MADTHKVIGNHPEEVAGVMYGPGESFTLTSEQAKDPVVVDLVNIGSLMQLSVKGGEKVDA